MEVFEYNPDSSLKREGDILNRGSDSREKILESLISILNEENRVFKKIVEKARQVHDGNVRKGILEAEKRMEELGFSQRDKDILINEAGMFFLILPCLTKRGGD